MGWFLFVVLTLIAFGLTQAIYVVLQAVVGWSAGATVEAIAIGCGPNLFGKNIRGVSWRIGAMPWGASTKFFGSEDSEDAALDAPDKRDLQNKTAFNKIPLLGRVAVMLVGPLSYVFIGLTCVAIPVWNGGDQVVVNRELPMQWEKNGVPYLTVAQHPSTWAGQKELFANTTLEFGIRVMTFKSLEGWGGFIAWLWTLGSAGTNSLAVWLSCFGVTVIGIGAANLLPIPVLNGGHVLFQLTGAIFGTVPERFLIAATYFGMMFVLLLMGRIILLDIAWF